MSRTELYRDSFRFPKDETLDSAILYEIVTYKIWDSLFLINIYKDLSRVAFGYTKSIEAARKAHREVCDKMERVQENMDLASASLADVLRATPISKFKKVEMFLRDSTVRSRL